LTDVPLLEVKGLRTEFRSGGSVFAAVDGVSFTLAPGETLGIVGESGCGKSVTSLSIMRLVPNPPGRVAAGEILLEGRNLLALPEHEMQAIRGDAISMIFQEPMTSLNPVQTVGEQIVEAVRLHRVVSSTEARARALEMLRLVKIPSPETRLDEYPHQLSGGMRQRVMIAMALACDPKILRRPDLGRLAPGCKADFSLVDMSHPYMKPAHEPVRSLIYSASDRAIKHVYVDGTQVVRDGKVLTVDVEAATAGLIEGQRKRLETVSQRDWAGRTVDQLAPPVYGTKDRLPQSRPVS